MSKETTQADTPAPQTHMVVKPTAWLVKIFSDSGMLLDTRLEFVRPVFGDDRDAEFIPLYPSPEPHVDAVDKARAWDAAQASFQKGYEKGKAEAATATQHHVTGWQSMETAPKDGKHCILSIPTGGGFIYSIQGAFMNGKWMNAANIEAEPLAWMPNVLLPDELCPWTEAYKARTPSPAPRAMGTDTTPQEER